MDILNSGNLTQGRAGNTAPAIILYNRILQLRSQKKELEEKQGLIIRDPDLKNAIHVIDNEIECAQG
jgi:hypothetical protein